MAMKFSGDCWTPSDNSVGYDVTIGVFNSATAGYGKKLSSAKTKSLDVCCDDGGAALSATAYRAIRGRMLLTYAQSGDCSPYGLQGHLKNTAADTTTGNKAGVWGYYEAVSGATVASHTSGVFAMIDVPSGATIAASAVVGALQIGSNDLGGTHTGSAVGINFTEALTGAFDAAISFPSGSEFITASQLTGGTSQYIKILIDGVPFTIAATRAS
ncbi:MAG: hypothetical protein NTV01_05705 [Bacteroidia bacterium]|nr:hypothetical protein [Bacteroidia bacterium]